LGIDGGEARLAAGDGGNGGRKSEDSSSCHSQGVRGEGGRAEDKFKEFKICAN